MLLRARAPRARSGRPAVYIEGIFKREKHAFIFLRPFFYVEAGLRGGAASPARPRRASRRRARCLVAVRRPHDLTVTVRPRLWPRPPGCPQGWPGEPRGRSPHRPRPLRGSAAAALPAQDARPRGIPAAAAWGPGGRGREPSPRLPRLRLCRRPQPPPRLASRRPVPGRPVGLGGVPDPSAAGAQSPPRGPWHCPPLGPPPAAAGTQHAAGGAAAPRAPASACPGCFQVRACDPKSNIFTLFLPKILKGFLHSAT